MTRSDLADIFRDCIGCLNRQDWPALGRRKGRDRGATLTLRLDETPHAAAGATSACGFANGLKFTAIRKAPRPIAQEAM